MKLKKLSIGMIGVYSIFLMADPCFAQNNLGASLDSLFTSYLDSGFSGSVLAAKKNDVIFKKGYGYSNYETKKLNSPETLYNVASIGKHFTVYALLLLEKRGLLSTSDCLSKYIGKFNDARDSLTIHHLLIHRSGLTKDGAPLDYTTREKFIRSIKEGEPDSIPGKKYRYSNAGFSMLAAVVEIISGEPFEHFLLKNIFEPLKMKNTGYPWEQHINKDRMATGYNNKKQPVPPQVDTWATRGPGNLVTSVEDLSRWMKAFQDEKFISAEMKKKIFFEYFPGEDSYGWTKTLTNRKTRFYYKGGGRSDFENRLMWFPNDDVMIIFSINNDYNLARNIFTKIRVLMN